MKLDTEAGKLCLRVGRSDVIRTSMSGCAPREQRVLDVVFLCSLLIQQVSRHFLASPNVSHGWGCWSCVWDARESLHALLLEGYLSPLAACRREQSCSQTSRSI